MAKSDSRSRRFAEWLRDNWLQLASIVMIPVLTIGIGIIAQNRQAQQNDFTLALQIEGEREKHGEQARQWAVQQIALYTVGSSTNLGSLPPELKKRLCFAPNAELLKPIDYRESGIGWPRLAWGSDKKLESNYKRFISKQMSPETTGWAIQILLRYEALLSEIRAGCEAVQQAP